MAKGLWDDIEDGGGFRDIPEEVNGDFSHEPVLQEPPRATKGRVVEQPQYEEQYEEELQAEIDEEDDDFSVVLSDARLRLEQGRLYEMIMNSDLFQGSGADEKAVKNVQRQMRNFAKEQMEVMLGMRQTTSAPSPLAEPAQSFEVRLPFNELEITTLKKIASAATKGATEQMDQGSVTEAAPVVRQPTTLQPIALKAQRPATMAVARRQVAAPAPISRPAKAASAPLQKTKEPLRRTKITPTAEAILAKAEVTPEQLDTVMDVQQPLKKHPSQLTPEEISKRNAAASKRSSRRSVKNPNAPRMPTLEEANRMIETQVLQAGVSPGLQTIMNLINNPKR